MDDETGFRHGKGTYFAIIGLVGVTLFVALVFLGGQTTRILSNVGNAIGVPDGAGGDTTGAVPDDGGGTVDPGGVTDTTDDDGKGGEVADAEATAPEMLIIRTGQLELQVADLDSAVTGARSRVFAVGGYVSSSEERAGDDAAATVTFRIPADRWDDALTAVRGISGETRHLQVQTQAVTGQVIDLGARITNLRATEGALQAIMNQATKIPDVLEVQGKLSDVRGEIERLSAEKAHLEEQAAYGTLTVTFVLPTPPAVEEVKAGWDPAGDADAAAGTLIKIGQRLTSFGIWAAIVGLPIVMVLLAGVALVLVARRLIGRSHARPGES